MSSNLETAKQAVDFARNPGKLTDALETKVADFLKQEAGGVFGKESDSAGAIHGDSRSQLQTLRDNVDLRKKFLSGLSGDERKDAESRLGGVAEIADGVKKAKGMLNELSDKAKLAGAGATLAVAAAKLQGTFQDSVSGLSGKSGLDAAEAGLGFFEKMGSGIKDAMASIMKWFAAAFPQLAGWLGVSAPAETASASAETDASTSAASMSKADKISETDAAKRAREGIEKFDSGRFVQEQEAALEKTFAEKYGVDFDEGRRKRLHDLLAESAKDAKGLVDAKALEQKFKTDGLTIGDAYPIITSGVLSSGKFLTMLVARNIVPASALGVELVGQGTRQVVLTLDALGIRNVLSVETYRKIVGNMNEQERMVALALLYRKGGMLFTALAELTYQTTHLAMAFATDTAAVGYKTFPRAMLNNYVALAKDFQAIETAMGVSAQESGAKVLMAAVENTGNIARNYQWLDAQRRCGGSPKKFLELCEKEGVAVPEESRIKFAKIGEGAGSAERFGQALADDMKVLENRTCTIKTIAGKFVMNQTGRTVVYNESLNEVANMQRRLAVGGDGFARFKKPFEALRVSQVSRIGDHMMWSFRNKADFEQTIRELAMSSPEVLRTALDKMPIFAVAGMVVTSDEPMLTALQKEWMYLVPVLGPILLIGNAGFNSDWKPRNMGDLLAGSALLTFDGYHLIKGGLPGAAKYVFKPVVDVYEIAQTTSRVAWAGTRLGAEILGGGRFAEFLGATVKSGPGRLAKWTALVALLVWGGYELLTPDERQQIERKYGVKEGDSLAALKGEERDRMAEFTVREALRREGFSGATVTAANGALRVSAEGVRPDAAGHLATVGTASLLQCGLDGYRVSVI